MEKLKKLLAGRKATYVEKTPEDVYREVAEGLDQFSPEDIAKIGGLESEHGKFDKPKQGGSARGLFQFQPPTAEELEPGSAESISDMNTQASLMAKYLEKNNAQSPEEAFSYHNLGTTGGKRFFSADDDALVSTVIPERVIRANPSLYGVKTVGEAKALIKKRLQSGEDSIELAPTIMDLFKEKK